ncbi:MAG: hypothetical protein GXY07_19520 [Candidatus Hydrogenedentes bacterium]|nr:hypothetical protein [Candidatus Hydrogenedentota bacterium]
MSKWKQRLQEHIIKSPEENYAGFAGESLKHFYDPDAILERSAIMEFDGGLSPREKANMNTSKSIDRQRQVLRGDISNAKRLYKKYISEWHPEHCGDKPAIPPNFRGNEALWRAWWKQVERYS